MPTTVTTTRTVNITSTEITYPTCFIRNAGYTTAYLKHGQERDYSITIDNLEQAKLWKTDKDGLGNLLLILRASDNAAIKYDDDDDHEGYRLVVDKTGSSFRKWKIEKVNGARFRIAVNDESIKDVLYWTLCSDSPGSHVELRKLDQNVQTEARQQWVFEPTNLKL